MYPNVVICWPDSVDAVRCSGSFLDPLQVGDTETSTIKTGVEELSAKTALRMGLKMGNWPKYYHYVNREDEDDDDDDDDDDDAGGGGGDGGGDGDGDGDGGGGGGGGDDDDDDLLESRYPICTESLRVLSISHRVSRVSHGTVCISDPFP